MLSQGCSEEQSSRSSSFRLLGVSYRTSSLSVSENYVGPRKEDGNCIDNSFWPRKIVFGFLPMRSVYNRGPVVCSAGMKDVMEFVSFEWPNEGLPCAAICWAPGTLDVAIEMELVNMRVKGIMCRKPAPYSRSLSSPWELTPTYAEALMVGSMS